MTREEALEQLVPADPRRWPLLAAIAAMPEEAFLWLVTSIALVPGRPNAWPDALGGFSPTSQIAILDAQHAAAEYLGGGA